MKKTLERLKEEAFADGELCLEIFENLWKKIDDMNEEAEELLIYLSEYVPRTLISLLRYVQALEDYGYEIDKEWDKLLKNIEETREQSKSIQKERKKKPSYIK